MFWPEIDGIQFKTMHPNLTPTHDKSWENIRWQGWIFERIGFYLNMLAMKFSTFIETYSHEHAHQTCKWYAFVLISSKKCENEKKIIHNKEIQRANLNDTQKSDKKSLLWV